MDQMFILSGEKKTKQNKRNWNKILSNKIKIFVNKNDR